MCTIIRVVTELVVGQAERGATPRAFNLGLRSVRVVPPRPWVMTPLLLMLVVLWQLALITWTHMMGPLPMDSPRMLQLRMLLLWV